MDGYRLERNIQYNLLTFSPVQLMFLVTKYGKISNNNIKKLLALSTNIYNL